LKTKITCTEKIKEKLLKEQCVAYFLEDEIVSRELDVCPLDDAGKKIPCKECFEKNHVKFEIIEEDVKSESN
jgi:hypothetical protein